MLITDLKENPEKIKERNNRVREIDAEYPDIGILDLIEDSVYDQIVPYRRWLALLQKEENLTFIMDTVVPDDVFVSNGSLQHELKTMTDYDIAGYSSKNWYYGTCDNAAQAVAQLNKCIEKKEVDGDVPLILALSPVFRSTQDQWGGFRYHKWGEYIGVQNPRHEYLYDDQHIDLIYVFEIHELVPQKDKGE